MEVPEPEDVRIITTLGHVDHGKTTLMDALLAANNIISSRMAGKLRYLDSREDEQERGITMEASAVSLKFQALERSAVGQGRSTRNYVVNMIDTPGHVDFSSEVSTASRLCDGALVLVDVVEGVCTQTIAVLRQAWKDRLRPILVVNKFDRLITELKLAPTEAYHHLTRLIEQVNAIMGDFFASERMEDDLRWREERERRLAQKKDAIADQAVTSANDADEFQERDDEDIYFSPEKGNVVFASALDGWGFRVAKFAQLYSAKLGYKEANLRRVLWGDFYLDPKTKRVINHKHLKGRALKTLFVQFVLENIWAVYDAVMIHPNPEKISKIIQTLDLKIPARELKSKDARHVLSVIFSQWLSLSTAIIQAVIDVVPSPTAAQALRVPKMLHPDLYEQTVKATSKLEEDLFSSNAGTNACVVAYVSKMFAVERSALPENKRKPLTADEMRNRSREMATPLPQSPSVNQALAGSDLGDDHEQHGEDEVVLGFARVYSGRISINSSIYCVLPKYKTLLGPDHPHNSQYLLKAKIDGLYIMMGRELVPVDSVSAGNIFAVRGLEGKVWRSATLCAPTSVGLGENMEVAQDREFLVNLGAINSMAKPIVRVALEPAVPADMPQLVAGLKLLSQADPCVETFQQQTGEHVIVTAGELHLERCLKDLRERFARVDIQVSEPIVPFRETAVRVHDMAPTKTPNAPRGTIHGASSQNYIQFTIRAVPLPAEILRFLLDNHSSFMKLQQDTARQGSQEVMEDVELDTQAALSQRPNVDPSQFWSALHDICSSAGKDWSNIAERVWAVGPHRLGGCLLIDSRGSLSPRSLQRQHALSKGETAKDHESSANELDFDNYVETGFQLAVGQGPLCAEPVEGMIYFVERITIDQAAIEKETSANRLSQITGSLITAVRDACRNGLLDWSPRLMLAMYSCEIQASPNVLGKVYGVVARRRGRIVAEEMKEGTSFFTVTALLPVVESFGFADDIRKRTSGAASPQLIFSGYELLDQDPFWVPTTEEELEDLGEKADRSNVAKEYMDGVRTRKGLFVDRKIVEFAEKQRTLKR